MKLREVSCVVCGARFTIKANCAKYCERCKKEAYEKKKKQHQVTLLCDTEEMLQACLKCTRPRCGGECEELACVARGEA